LFTATEAIRLTAFVLQPDLNVWSITKPNKPAVPAASEAKDSANMNILSQWREASERCMHEHAGGNEKRLGRPLDHLLDILAAI
jgi:hypothetical protein